MKTAFVFPGQGSQFAGMGRDVAERFEEAREVFDSVDRVLGFELSRLCFEGPEEQLKLTENTQPAILTVSSAIHAVIGRRSSLRADFVAGHSLGEYSAIVAAGGLTAAEAASIVRQRGRFMQEAVPVGEGAMAAILGPSLDEIRSICEEASEGEVVSPANVNAPGQIVVAGARGAVERAMAVAKSRGVRRSLALPVSAPFHCSLMKPAEEKLRPVLEAAPFAGLRVPVVTNVDAEPASSPDDVRSALVRQVVSPVRWIDVIERMIALGVTRFVEIGPGSVLAGMIRRIAPDAEATSIGTAAALDEFLAKSE
jgi:[acyl-carrier-protein] S-malonyltransferase